MSPHLINILTGPSGVGKGTLCKLLLRQCPDLYLSVSATTRPIRPGEQDGVSYHFRTREMFEAMIAHDRDEPDPCRHQLLEWAVYNGHYYGTPREALETCLADGKRVLLEIETQGALQVKAKFPASRLIFIAPPDMETLRLRLLDRGTNTEADILNRLAIAAQELALQAEFDTVLINDSLETCLAQLLKLLATDADSHQ